MEYIQLQKYMGTEIEIQIFESHNINHSPNIEQDISKGFQLFSEMEAVFSRFQESSELSQLNSVRKKEVSQVFVKVLKKSLEFYKQTQGFFNPTVDIGSLGYNVSFEKMKKVSTGKEQIISQKCDIDSINISENIISLLENISLDFGGIVKGFTVDVVKEFFLSQGYNNFLINAGGDIFVHGRDESDEKCVIGIDHPNTGEIFATIELENQSISTSGTYKRKWVQDGEIYHHIVNPFTYKNNQDILSITILSNSCVESDVYATSCIAMGFQKAQGFLEENNISALIFLSNGEIVTIGDKRDLFRLVS